MDERYDQIVLSRDQNHYSEGQELGRKGLVCPGHAPKSREGAKAHEVDVPDDDEHSGALEQLTLLLFQTIGIAVDDDSLTFFGPETSRSSFSRSMGNASFK